MTSCRRLDRCRALLPDRSSDLSTVDLEFPGEQGFASLLNQPVADRFDPSGRVGPPPTALSPDAERFGDRERAAFGIARVPGNPGTALWPVVRDSIERARVLLRGRRTPKRPCLDTSRAVASAICPRRHVPCMPSQRLAGPPAGSFTTSLRVQRDSAQSLDVHDHAACKDSIVGRQETVEIDGVRVPGTGVDRQICETKHRPNFPPPPLHSFRLGRPRRYPR